MFKYLYNLYYFIKIFFNIVHSMIAVIKKNLAFKWIIDCWKCFRLLKKYFITILILVYFDFEKEYIVKTNTLKLFQQKYFLSKVIIDFSIL